MESTSNFNVGKFMEFTSQPNFKLFKYMVRFSPELSISVRKTLMRDIKYIGKYIYVPVDGWICTTTFLNPEVSVKFNCF